MSEDRNLTLVIFVRAFQTLVKHLDYPLSLVLLCYSYCTVLVQYCTVGIGKSSSTPLPLFRMH